jgi:hypothetical protein
MKYKKSIFIVGVILIILVISYFVFSYISPQRESQINPSVTVAVSPETTLAQTTNAQPQSITLSFTLMPENSMTITSAYLETIGTTTIPSEQVQLSKNNNDSFTGTLVAPSEWLTKPQTVSFVLYINSVKTAKIVRFASTDVAITLPPDPGEAGKATLAGIDSNHDGVRDDLEREIVYMYPQNEQVRRVLTAMVKKEQDIITTSGDHEYFKGLTESFFAFEHCYQYLVFGNNIIDYTNSDILWNMLINTPERKKADKDHNYIALPYTSNVDYKSEYCNQPLIKGQY